jgi:hypothetical protein
LLRRDEAGGLGCRRLFPHSKAVCRIKFVAARPQSDGKSAHHQIAYPVNVGQGGNTLNALEAAITVKESVKQRITFYRSDNKKTPNPEAHGITLTAQQVSDRQQANQAVNTAVMNLRKNHNNPQVLQVKTLKNIMYYGALALAAGYGNCLEVSCAAAWSLNELLALGDLHVFNFDFVYYPQGADHVFVVLDENCDANGDFPTSFANWSANAVICDVWADIACPAQEYPVRWRARMQNWSIMGMTIGSANPTQWSNAVDLPKKSYLHS